MAELGLVWMALPVVVSGRAHTRAEPGLVWVALAPGKVVAGRFTECCQYMQIAATLKEQRVDEQVHNGGHRGRGCLDDQVWPRWAPTRDQVPRLQVLSSRATLNTDDQLPRQHIPCIDATTCVFTTANAHGVGGDYLAVHALVAAADLRSAEPLQNRQSQAMSLKLFCLNRMPTLQIFQQSVVVPRFKGRGEHVVRPHMGHAHPPHFRAVLKLGSKTVSEPALVGHGFTLPGQPALHTWLAHPSCAVLQSDGLPAQ
eukprot:365688-Chlamydomonas_euryale.AAC.2